MKTILPSMLVIALFSLPNGAVTACNQPYVIQERQNEFERKIWMQDDGRREDMLDSMLQNNHLIGQKRKNVQKLLGQPSSKTAATDTYSLQGHQMGCGACPFTSFIIGYKADRVIKYRIWQNPEYISNYKKLQMHPTVTCPAQLCDGTWRYK